MLLLLGWVFVPVYIAAGVSAYRYVYFMLLLGIALHLQQLLSKRIYFAAILTYMVIYHVTAKLRTVFTLLSLSVFVYVLEDVVITLEAQGHKHSLVVLFAFCRSLPCQSTYKNVLEEGV